MTFVPVYKTVDEIRQNIEVVEGGVLCNPGKLFVYGDYIFVNELRKGIHIIDNSVQENPTSIAFIDIPGNVDIAVKDNILYADNYIDLVYFDISIPTRPIYKGRVEDVFNSISLHNDLGHLVHYEEKEVTVEYDCNYRNKNHFDDQFISNQAGIDNSIPSFEVFGGGPSGGAAPQGIAGSLSRFANAGEYLYVIDESAIDVFDISDRCNPLYIAETFVESGIETLFPVGSNLFIGANDGVHIYSLDNPVTPTYRSKFEHARSCDPVFVQDQTAYVTLRDGQQCQGFNNQLDVLDVSDLVNPSLITSVEMENPHGLSLSDDILMICEGKFGFKVFDKSDINDISNNELSHIDNIHAYDVIILPGTTSALVIGMDGLYQYDFSNPKDPFEISQIVATRDCDE